MRTIVKGKNIDVPDHVRRYAERKLGRLERILDDRSDALVELSVEQHRSAAVSHIVEVTLVIDGKTLRTHAAGRDPPGRRRRGRRQARAAGRRPSREAARPLPPGRGEAPPPADRRRHLGRRPERRIVKSKRFAIEPMFEEDAIARMEELGHEFFVYVDAQSERVQILYRRQDGNYGMIEPVVGGEYTKGRGRGSDRTNGRHCPTRAGDSSRARPLGGASSGSIGRDRR